MYHHQNWFFSIFVIFLCNLEKLQFDIHFTCAAFHLHAYSPIGKYILTKASAQPIFCASQKFSLLFYHLFEKLLSNSHFLDFAPPQKYTVVQEIFAQVFLVIVQ